MSDFLGNLINSAYGASDAIQPRLGPIFGNSPVIFAERLFEFEETAPPGESTSAAEHLPPRESSRMNHDRGDESAQGRDFFTMPETAINDATTPRQSKLASNFDRPFSYSYSPMSGSEKSEVKFAANPPEVAEESPATQVAAGLPLSQFRPAKISLQKNNLTAPPKSKTAMAPDQHSARPAKIFESIRIKTGLSSPPVVPLRGEDFSAKENFAAGQFDDTVDSASTAIAAMRSEPMFPLTSLRPFTEPFALPQNSKAASEPAPVIHVNIGRIEVRAVTPAAPPVRPQRARPGPMLSLEDYLKQRGGQR